MALPPIISNLPIIKLFKSNAPANNQTNTEQAKAQALKDSVSISAAAARGLKLSGTSPIKDDEEARGVAQQTNALLSENDLPLGLDPKFT